MLLMFATTATAFCADMSEEEALEQTFRKAVERVTPSLAAITVEWKTGSERVQVRPGVTFRRGPGPVSGFIVDADGTIVTSDFNVDEYAQKITVTLADGRSFEAKMTGRDAGRGLRLLKIDAKGLPVPGFVPKKEIRVGQWALAVGVGKSAKEPRLSLGIVSADDRIQGRAIQIDAQTNPANYGGPVLDIQGRVMGIITPLTAAGTRGGVVMSDTGVGFAAHAADLQRNLEEMKKGKTIRPAFLGIRFDPSQIKGGARVIEVLADHGAEEAGIKADDIITEFNGEKIDHSFKLLHVIGRCQVGDEVKFTVKRGDETLELTATLGERPETP
jgi:serine protease Do